MSTQTLQPLIWLARRWARASVRGGTPAFSVAAASVCSACRASGTIIAGFFIRACMVLSCRVSVLTVSHRMRSTRHRHDGSTRENVTDGQARRAGAALRGGARPPARGGVPDARVARRGRGRGPGGLAPARPRRQRQHRQPGGLADDGGRARMPGHAALAQVARRAAARRSGAGRGHAPDPEEEALLADSVGLALLVVLDTLEPAERLAFVLHDLFDLSFDEIAPIVGRSTAAARQLAR